MNGNQDLPGLMMRHGGTYGPSLRVHEAGPSSIEWAILGLAIAILVIAGLLLLDACQRRRRRFWSGPSGSDKELAILRLRYAKGEISRDEYSQALSDLGASQERPAVPVDDAESKPEEAQPKRRRGRK